MLIEIRRHMLSLVRLSGLSPGAFQTGEGENLSVQASRIGVHNCIARVVGLLSTKNCDDFVNDMGIDQRTIRGDAYHGLDLIRLCRMVVAIQNILFRSSKAIHLYALTLADDG